MNVLSLFDGMSCGRLALDRIGIFYESSDVYYSSEIDKHAIAVANYNYPTNVQLGDVTNWRNWDIDWSSIDLLLGGSPCQGFSVAGKQLNFNDPRSKLFFEFVDILNHIKSKNSKVKFLLENVPMKKEWLDTISECLCVEPYMINSSNFSAQERKRYYWSNFEVTYDLDEENKNKKTVEDILEENVSDKYFIEPKQAIIICENEVKRRKIGYIGTDSQGNRIYNIHGKGVTLCGNGGGLGAKTGLYAIPCITPERINKRQNGRRFKPPYSKFYTLTAQDKHGVLVGNYIRKLTPVECERLQTVPDHYTEIASDTQRYRMLGNGWTVDVIAYILSHIF